MMIKSEYTHEVFRKDIHCPQGLLENKNYAELENFFNVLWQSRSHKLPQLWENEWFDQPKQMFKDIFLNHGITALKHINEWHLAFPESFFPYIVRVRYWAFWAAEYRGQEWSSNVTDEMWDCAREAQKQLYASAMQAFAFSAETWTIALHLLNSAVHLDEPEWFAEWMLKRRYPSNLVHKIKPSAQAMAQKSGLNQDLKIDLPQDVPQLLQKYLNLKEEIDLPQAHAAFWLKIFIEESGFGLLAVRDYCWYLLPRWGHDHQAIIDFAQSDWCQHFSEIEKSELNYIVWFDTLDTSFDKDQTLEIKKYIQKAQAILKRPLTERNRAVIYLKLAYFYYLLDENDPRILSCYQNAADYPVFDEYELDRAIYFWRHNAQDSDFLGRIALSNRKRLASAAVLYGFLCQHGWSSVEKNPLVAQSWYEQAKLLEAPKAYPEGRYCCFFRVANNFDDDHGYIFIIDLLHQGADLGFVYCCFSAGYIHSLAEHALYDVNQELYYAKKAADQGHYIAMYNMGIHYLNLSMDENQSQPKEYLKKSLGYFEQSRLGLEKSQQDHRYINSDLLNDLIDIYVTRLFNFSYYPEIAEQMIAVLKTKAHKRHIAAMCAIARLHFDLKNRPHYYDYAEAVKWCQAAYLQDPEHDLVKEVLYEIMGNTKRSIKKYNQTIANIAASDIPGRQDVLI